MGGRRTKVSSEVVSRGAVGGTPGTQADRRLREIVAGTSAETGQAFFETLVQHLASAIGVRHALACEMLEGRPGKVRTLAFWSGGGLAENLEYDLAGTPCEQVAARKTCFHGEDVQERFPDDHLIAEMGVTSYLGTPLFGRAGNPLGLLVVMDEKPIEDAPNSSAILEIFAGRAGAELERMRTEAALRGSEKRYKLLASAGFEGVVIHQGGRLIDVNEAAAEMFGYEVAEGVGALARDFMAPESHHLLRKWGEAGARGPLELVGQRKDGTTFPVEILGRPLNDEERDDDSQDGVRMGVVAVRDLTERKEAEAARRRSEERLRLLAEHAQDIIIRYRLTSPRGYEYVSPAVVAVTGYTPEDFYADPDMDTRVMHPEDHGPFRQAIAEFRTEATEARWIRKDGSVLWTEQRLSHVFDETGARVAIEGIIRDISERKEAERKLRRAREELEGKVEHQMLRRNPYGLTFRELTVLNLVAGGKTDKDIATELGISPRTVHKHVANVRAKMGTTSRTEAGVRAVREGLLE